MYNFVQQIATYPYMPNTGYRTFNGEMFKLTGKYRSIMKNMPPEPPEQPLFNPLQPPFVKRFNGGRASGALNREMLYKLNQQNMDLYQEKYY